MNKLFLFLRRMLGFSIVSGFAIVGIVAFSNIWITKSSEAKMFDTVTQIPKNKVGLVLGTIKILPNGRLNYYFKYRIDAAAQLYHSGKVEYLLVSGDNRKRGYNEPEDMRAALIEKGVPASKIYLDYAGFRTLDSVVRCKEIFGQNKFTVVSQAFHNQRALFIGNKRGMDLVGFNAKNVSQRYGRKTNIREVLAKTAAVLDLYFLNRMPKYLGEKIIIGKDPIVRSD